MFKKIFIALISSILIYSNYDVNAEESILTDLTNNAGVSQSANRDDLAISYIPNEYNKTYPPLGTAYYPNDNYYINRFHIRSYNANVKKFIKGYYYNVEYVLYTNPIYEFLYCGTPGEASCSNESNNFMIMSGIFDQILMYGAPNPNYDTTSQNYISELSCSIGTRISTYEWTINCSFSPTRDLHGIYTAFYTDTSFYGSFQAKFPWYNMNQFRVQSVEITQNTGLEGAIDNQTQIIINGNNQINNNLDNINGSINDSDVSESESAFGDFFNGFTTNTHGLTGIITSPLHLIGSITSSTCSDLVLPLPYVNKNLSLPCMSSIYFDFFGDFFILYQTITFGIISYWVIIRIFNLVKDFKNPEHDEIEVLEL